MIEDLYILDYTHHKMSDHTPMDANTRRDELSLRLVRHTSLYGMGEEYGIHELIGIASQKFAVILRHGEYLVDGQYFSMINVKALGEAIKCIYKTTPESDRGLRDQVLGYAKRCLKNILPSEVFKAVLAEVPQFAYQLLVLEAGSKVIEEPVAKKRKLREVTTDGFWGLGD